MDKAKKQTFKRYSRAQHISFQPGDDFKRHYDRIYKQNCEAANMLLLLCEMADGNGEVLCTEEEIATLMAIRFNDPTEYALEGTVNE